MPAPPVPQRWESPSAAPVAPPRAAPPSANAQPDDAARSADRPVGARRLLGWLAAAAVSLAFAIGVATGGGTKLEVCPRVGTATTTTLAGAARSTATTTNVAGANVATACSTSTTRRP